MRQQTIKTLLIILLLTFDSFGQDVFIEDGWKGIKPLRTDRAAVEKVVGKPKASLDGYYNYETDDFFIQVNYSTAPCWESDYNRGKYNVPEDTVLSYHVILNEGIKLSEFKFKRENYRKEEDDHRRDIFYYVSSEDAIMLGIGVIDGIEYVGRLRFYPTPNDEKKFECKKAKAAIGNEQPQKAGGNQACEKPK